jgi:hypothetical protein
MTEELAAQRLAARDALRLDIHHVPLLGAC